MEEVKPLLLALSQAEWLLPLGRGALSVRLFDSRYSSQGSEVQERHPLESGQMWGVPVQPGADVAAIPLLYDGRKHSVSVAPLQLREQSEYHVEVHWEGEGEMPSLQCFPHLHPPVMREEPTLRSRTEFRASLNFRDYVGATQLQIWSQQRQVFSVHLEVRSKKLSYLEDYVSLLDEMAGRSVGFLLRLGSPVHAGFASSPTSRSPAPIESFLILRHIVRSGDLRQAVEALCAAPTRMLSRERSRGTMGQHLPKDSRALAMGFRGGGEILTLAAKERLPAALAGRLPRHFPRQHNRLHWDTPENRFVRSLFLRMEQLLGALLREFQRSQTLDPLRELHDLQVEVRQLGRQLPFFHEVGPLTGIVPRQKLSRWPAYRRLLEIWDLLSWGLGLSWDALTQAIAGPIRDLAQLYELWCFFELWDALNAVAEPLEEPSDSWSLDPVAGRLAIDLPQGERPAGRWKLGDAELRLYYQRRFRSGAEALSSYSIALTPDYTLEASRPGVPEVLLCFDAKYRPEGALEKMHAYRDALRGALGCYLFYPGSEEQPTLYHRHPRYPLPGVGAFPMRPSATGRQWLVPFLQLALEQILTAGSREDPPK